VVASEPFDTAAWQSVPQGTALTIAPDGSCRQESLVIEALAEAA
jgi:hypothetical protein